MDKRSVTGPRARFRWAAASVTLLMALVNLTLLGQYRAAVLERVPDAPPGAVKAGVAAALLFGSVLNALGVLVLLFLAGAAGAAACRAFGTHTEFTRVRVTVALAVALFLAAKVIVITAASLAFGVPQTRHVTELIGSADLSLLLLAAGCAFAVRRVSGLTWGRSAVCAAAPTAVFAAFCLIPT
ncbi:hypothetical protein AB0C51_09730 [Streptomyces pathocidini]|uniref:hypothetical protein n=1 Tax=Streptomyces pathocidini TaxID=1650571 RepID=UPI0033D731DA